MKKLYLSLTCLLLVFFCYGQRSQKKNGFNQSGRKADIFLHKQWWLGFKAGPNLSGVVVQTPYAVIAPVNYDVHTISKKYKNFRVAGSQVSFEVTFNFKGLSISLQPTYRTNRFSYQNNFAWSDIETPDNRLVLHYDQEQKTAYLDWPVMAKYEFSPRKIKPYIQAGLYSSLLLDATKSVRVSGTDYAAGGANEFSNESIIIGASDLFARYHWGFIAGGGFYYPLGNVRINLDITYRYGMSNISSTDNRYGSDRLSGVGDSLDDLKLNSISVSAGCLFPLRFLGSGFRSMTDN